MWYSEITYHLLPRGDLPLFFLIHPCLGDNLCWLWTFRLATLLRICVLVRYLPITWLWELWSSPFTISCGVIELSNPTLAKIARYVESLFSTWRLRWVRGIITTDPTCGRQATLSSREGTLGWSIISSGWFSTYPWSYEPRLVSNCLGVSTPTICSSPTSKVLVAWAHVENLHLMIPFFVAIMSATSTPPTCLYVLTSTIVAVVLATSTLFIEALFSTFLFCGDYLRIPVFRLLEHWSFLLQTTSPLLLLSPATISTPTSLTTPTVLPPSILAVSPSSSVSSFLSIGGLHVAS